MLWTTWFIKTTKNCIWIEKWPHNAKPSLRRTRSSISSWVCHFTRSQTHTHKHKLAQAHMSYIYHIYARTLESLEMHWEIQHVSTISCGLVASQEFSPGLFPWESDVCHWDEPWCLTRSDFAPICSERFCKKEYILQVVSCDFLVFWCKTSSKGTEFLKQRCTENSLLKADMLCSLWGLWRAKELLRTTWGSWLCFRLFKR